MDLYFFMAKSAFEVSPDAWLNEGIESVEDEISPIGLKERARFDLHEVCSPRAPLVNDSLNSAEEVPVFGIRLNDNGDSLGRCIVDQHIHLVFKELVFLSRCNF